MSRSPSEDETGRRAQWTEGAGTIRIDEETFETVSVTGGVADGDSPRIVRWVETWTGADR